MIAGHDTVLSQQRETGLVMVEPGCFPGILAVAGAAVPSKGRLVGIRVAIAAAGEGKAFPLLVRVA